MRFLVLAASDERAVREEAFRLAKRLDARVVDDSGVCEGDLVLKVDGEGLALVSGNMQVRGDFSRMKRRLRPDALSRELVVRAARVKSGRNIAKPAGAGGAARPASIADIADAERLASAPAPGCSPARPIAVDATAGLGEDSLLLAAAGFEVVLFERDPVIAMLLENALLRAKDDSEFAGIVEHMRLICADSVSGLAQLSEVPDVVLLDPMFPAKRKSSQAKKKLQLIQRLEQPCEDESALLEAARSARPRKVVVKRPAKGPYLAGVKPAYTIAGKAIRFDCYLPAPVRA